jgi:MFS family permease
LATTAPTEAPAAAPSLGALAPIVLAAISLGGVIFTHDFAAIGIVVPEIQRHFDASLGSAQWAITGFSTAIALSVVPAGRLSDVYGADRVFVVGAIWFAAASALVAIAPALWFVIAARVLEGVGGACVWIAAIAMVFAHYGHARAVLAGALMVLVSGLGLALGPIDAGLLIEAIGWRAVFLVNIPFALLAGWLVHRNRGESVPSADRSVDWTGIGLLAAALVALLVTLRYAPEWGWGSAGTVVGFLIALGFGVALVVQQRAWGFRALVPPDVAANRVLAITLAGEALLGTSYYIVISFAPQVFANVLGANAIESGLMQAPTMVCFAIGGIVTGFLFTGLPPKATAVGAGALAALGGLVLALMPGDPTYLSILPGLALIGAGSGALFGALLTIGVSALPEERKGLAGGLLYTAQLAGGAIVLAAATAVATGVAEGSTDQRFGGFVQGARGAFGFGVAVAALGIVVVVLGYRGRSPGAAGTPTS